MIKIVAALAVALLLPVVAIAQGLAPPAVPDGPRLNAVPDPGADFAMALRYFAGEGVERDNRQGLEYLRRAAEAGYAEAQFNLGNYHNMFAADYPEAARWWRRAGQQGHAQALFNLAELLASELVPAEDGEHAAVYYQRAAALGFVAETEPQAPAPDVEMASVPVLAPPPPEPPQLSVIKVSPEPVTAAKADDPATASWLESAADSATIQIFASVSLAEARALVKRHSWRRDLALLSFARDGRQWHALLYGQFPDVATARRAMPELPPVLRAGKPWSRRMSDVRAQTQMSLQALPGKP
jgi:hypothetical protein